MTLFERITQNKEALAEYLLQSCDNTVSYTHLESDTEKLDDVSVSESDTEIPGQQELAKDYPELCPQVQTDTMDSEVREIYLNSLARKLIEDNKEWCIQDFNGRVLNVVESEKQYKQKFRGAYSVMYFPDPENEKVALSLIHI